MIPNPPSPNPFFAFDNGLNDEAHRSLSAKAETLRQLGYDGVGWRPGRVLEMRAELDRRGLKMFTLYTGAWIDGRSPPYDPQLPGIIRQLQGSDTIIWLTVHSSKDRPSSPAGDARALPVLRKIADLAAQAGLRAALYPHYGCWVQTVEDALRVVRRLDRPNVGVSFNLCHCLRCGNGDRIPKILRAARPWLYVVSINGADSKSRDWSRLIQTLDRGDFDLLGLLRQLRALNYAGPIGLQCYNIPGSVRENLTRSMRAWRRLSEQLRADSNRVEQFNGLEGRFGFPAATAPPTIGAEPRLGRKGSTLRSGKLDSANDSSR